MTYAVSGLIQASDYNGFINTNTNNVNNIWSTGTGNKGYGQTVIAAVSKDQIISATTQANIVQKTTLSAAHQGTTLGSWKNLTPVNGNIIPYEPNLLGNITLITNNRLNAVAQGATATTSSTSTSSWTNTLTYTFTVTFANNNSARYFFNAGGQIGFNFSHPAGTATNTQVHNLCLDTGTVYTSSPTSGTATISGTAYNGVTKVGGANPSGASINTNYGFYAFTPILVQIFQQTGGGGGYYYYYGGGVYLRIQASYNGAGVITYKCTFNNSGGGYYYYYYGGTVSAGTVANLVLRPPSTAYLANTWGTPSIGKSVVST